MSDIFLSYSREDLVTARRFAEGFEREGFSVWWDQSLEAGEAFDHATEKALEHARIVVVLWSKHSVESRWVRAEANQADRLKKLVPVEIEPCKRPIMFDLTQTAELSQWKGDSSDKGWQALVAGLRRQLGNVAKSSAITPMPATTANPASRKSWAIGIGVATLLIAGVFAFVLTRAPGTSKTLTATDASVAVLPFRDMSTAKDQEAFADGLTEEILNSLSRIRDLKVTARTSSFAFKGKDVDLRTIGEALDVTNILEGSVRKDGNQLRVTAQLINAVTGYRLWSKTYDRPFDEIFKIQDDIAVSVAQALEISLGVGELGSLPGMTRNVDAYEAYLSGIAAGPMSPSEGGGSATMVDGLTRSIGHFRRALEIDPEFALAWGSLGAAYGMVGMLTNRPSPESVAAVEQMSRLAPDSPETHLTLATGSYFAGDWIGAATNVANARAAALKSGVTSRVAADIDTTEANLLGGVGRANAALVVREKSIRRDPLNVGLSQALVTAYAGAGNFPAARAEIERGRRLDTADPASWITTEFNLALVSKDRVTMTRLADQLPGPYPDPAMCAAMRDLLDNPAAALSELRQRTAGKTDTLTLVTAITWAEYFGDPALAVSLMERVAGPSSNGIAANGLMSAHMRDARGLPAFKSLVRKIGLVDYWRKFEWADGCHAVGADDFECT